MRIALDTPILHEVAQRILDAAVEDSITGCLISTLTPSKIRPLVWIPPNTQTMAYRVVIVPRRDRPDTERVMLAQSRPSSNEIGRMSWLA